jgi:ribonuclease HI
MTMETAKTGICLKVFVDGASRGNPGPAGVGVLLTDEKGDPLLEDSRFLGERTNNQAEYEALIFGLSKVKELNPRSVKVFSDSELMVKQMRGEYRVKNELLKPLFKEAANLLDSLSDAEIIQIPRKENKRADQLANFSIDRNT